MNLFALKESQKNMLKAPFIARAYDALKQLVHFGWQQALSCLFPVVIFSSLAITKMIPVPWLPRYDLLLLIFLLMQWWMLRSGLENT